jgi:AcrR family transcriptional regulator
VTRLAVADRRAALVSAAVIVIARDGLGAATTRAIVAEAGMSLGSFHYAFDSRDDLITAVIQSVTDAERVEAESTLVSTGSDRADLATVLRAGIFRYLDLLEANPEREQALLELSLYAMRQRGSNREMLDQYRAYYAATEHSLALAALTCHRQWTVPLERVAHSLVVLLDGLTTTWLADRDSAAARFTGAFAADSLAGLSAPLDVTAQRSSSPVAPTMEYSRAD